MVAGGLVAGLSIRSLSRRGRQTDDEVTVDGLKEALYRLGNVVRTLEEAVGIKLLNPKTFSKGSGFRASTYNLKQLELNADQLASRILNVANRIRTQPWIDQGAASPRKTDTDFVPRIIEVPELGQAHETDYTDRVTAGSINWFERYPPLRDPAEFEPYHEMVSDPAEAAIISLYNRAVDDRNRRGDFQERFHPLRIGTINASDRRRDPGLAPEYREASDGNFLAIEDTMRMGYYVVPRFDLTVKEANYEAGAIGRVFDCPSWNPQLSYSRVMLRRPAFFEKNGQTWVLKNQGILDLGHGE